MPDSPKIRHGVEHGTTLGFVTITPIYGQQPLSYDKTTIMGTSSSSATFVEPIGRKELATKWWEGCPNQCMAHVPSNKPCAQYCKSLRKHVSVLSKKMIASEFDSTSHQKRILIAHSNAVQKRQSNLIHIIPIQQSSSTNSLDTMYYDLRIGNDWNRPWMQFHASIVSPHSTIIDTARTRYRSTPVKRALDFYAERNPNDDTHLSQSNVKRCSPSKNSYLDIQKLASRNVDKTLRTIPKSGEEEHCRLTNGKTTRQSDECFTDSPNDILPHHSEESENTVTSDDKPIISTQQLITATTTTSTPNDKSTGIRKVTPETELSSQTDHYSGRPFEGALSPERKSSQRQLFTNENDNEMDTFRLNQHCERLFNDTLVERQEYHTSSNPSNTFKVGLDDSKNMDFTNDKQSLSSQHENEEETYATYLSLPIPDSFVPTSLPIGMKTESLLLTEECPTRTNVADLTLHDWKNLKTRMESKSLFRQAMIDLILMRNNDESNPINENKLWLPSLFNKETKLSPSWKLNEDT